MDSKVAEHPPGGLPQDQEEESDLKSLDKMADRRRSLTEAAIVAIAEKGLLSVTVADIAREAGCAYGLVAHHFESKEKLLLATLDRLMERYREAWLTLAAENEGVPAKLGAFIDLDLGSSTIDERYISVISAFWAEAPRNPAYRRLFQCHHAAYMARLHPLITELAATEAPPLDPGLIARGLSALVDGLWIESEFAGPYAADDWVPARRIARAYLAAFFPKTLTWAGRDGGVAATSKRRRRRTTART